MKYTFNKNSIRNFIILWISVSAILVILIAASLLVSTGKLQSMTLKILRDAKATELAHQLETAILRERREDLMWIATRDSLYYREKNAEIKESDRIIELLKKNRDSYNERPLIDAIDRQFLSYKIILLSNPPDYFRKITTATDSLLQTVEIFREQNMHQMSANIEASSNLNKIVDNGSVLLILFITIMLIAGSMVLIQRIVKPTFALTHSAKEFGRGNYKQKARIFRNDELGLLCETFNDMVENISGLQQERLNFIASVAHDLKNPLVLIGAAAHRLRNKIHTTEDNLVWLDCIIERTVFIENLINDLMDSVQIETGNMTLQMVDLELKSFVYDIQKNYAGMISTHRIVFDGKHECLIKGDRRRLERSVSNIISNAVKYSPQNSTILIKVEKDEENAVISIKDEGPGIDPEDFQKLFLPFKRFGRTENMAKGTGLGLFSVKKIIDGHGGTIKVFSEPENGTKIEIVLPLSAKN